MEEDEEEEEEVEGEEEEEDEGEEEEEEDEEESFADFQTENLAPSDVKWFWFKSEGRGPGNRIVGFRNTLVTHILHPLVITQVPSKP